MAGKDSKGKTAMRQWMGLCLKQEGEEVWGQMEFSLFLVTVPGSKQPID